MPVSVLAGEEEFEIDRRAKALKEELVDPTFAAFNFVRLDNPDLRQVVDAAASVPFGPGNRMVLIERCDLFTKKRGKSDDDAEGAKSSKSVKLIDDFESALASIQPNTYLIFACIANFDSTLKISKIIAKHAQLEKFERKKYYAGAANKEIISWSNKEAHRFGAFIEDDAACYLAESSECNLRQMSSEIAKAATFILPEKTITLAHVKLLSPHFSQVFALLEHWAYGHKMQVLESLDELRARQISAHIVLATLQTTLSKWISLRTEMDKAQASSGRMPSLNELARRLAFDPRGAFIVEQDLKRIKGLSLSYLIGKKKQLTELEQLVKTGQLPEQHALSVFFTR